MNLKRFELRQLFLNASHNTLARVHPKLRILTD